MLNYLKEDLSLVVIFVFVNFLGSFSPISNVALLPGIAWHPRVSTTATPQF